MGAKSIQLNGENREIHAESLSQLLETLGYGADIRGIAAAVNDQIVPRSDWATHPLYEGDRVEIVGAVQGG